VVAVGVVGDDPHPSVHLDYLLPVGQLPRAVVLNTLEFVGVPISALEFIRTVLVEIPDFFDAKFLVVLDRRRGTSKRVYLRTSPSAWL
jgi:hypothetical protein